MARSTFVDFGIDINRHFRWGLQAFADGDEAPEHPNARMLWDFV